MNDAMGLHLLLGFLLHCSLPIIAYGGPLSASLSSYGRPTVVAQLFNFGDFYKILQQYISCNSFPGLFFSKLFLGDSSHFSDDFSNQRLHF